MLDNLSILVQAPALNLQLLIDGILIGAVFALAAYGMALVWGVTNIINLAQGEFVILGGFIAVACADLGLPPLIAVPVAAALLYLLGLLLFETVIVFVIGRDMFNSVLAHSALPSCSSKPWPSALAVPTASSIAGSSRGFSSTDLSASPR